MSSRRQVNFFISVAFEIVVSLVIESFPVDVISIELLSSEEFKKLLLKLSIIGSEMLSSELTESSPSSITSHKDPNMNTSIHLITKIK